MAMLMCVAQAYQQAPAYFHASWPAQQSTHIAAHTYPAQSAEPPAHRTEQQPEAANPSSAQQVNCIINLLLLLVLLTPTWMTCCNKHSALLCRLSMI